MKILFIGDIFGRPGRDLVKKLLPSIREKYAPDLILANAENLNHGNGFNFSGIQKMRGAGIDFFTSGNHVWDNSDGVSHLNEVDFPVLRPANFPDPDTPGRGYQIIEDKTGNKILLINLLGRVFMGKNFECPFRTADRILEENKNENLSAVFVDFHAETTSEKQAFGFYLDGRVSAVVGTHTHVATLDARVLENDTAYITDVGMTGSFDSVIGAKKELIIKSFLTQLSAKIEPETNGKMVFSAVLVEVDGKTKKGLNIGHIQEFINV